MKLFLLISIILFPSLSVNPRVGDCQPASCGKVTRISYPFWVSGQQPSYCGHPAFELGCGGDGVPVLKSSYDDYYFVRSIFYDNNSVWLGNSTLHGKCPLPQFNLTFSLSPLSISAVNEKLFFFYSCSGRSATNYYHVPCRNDTFVYLGGFDTELEGLNLSGECEAAVVPVVGIDGVNATGYEKLLWNGVMRSSCGTGLLRSGRWPIAPSARRATASVGTMARPSFAFALIGPI